MTEEYKPLFHQKQDLAAAGHIMMIFFEHDAVLYASVKGKEGFMCVFPCCGMITLLIGILCVVTSVNGKLEYQLLLFGIVLVVFSICHFIIPDS